MVDALSVENGVRSGGWEPARQSRRKRIKINKAVELENLRKQHGNPVVTDPFAWNSQKSNKTWDRGENYDSETGSGLEMTIPDAPRPSRV